MCNKQDLQFNMEPWAWWDLVYLIKKDNAVYGDGPQEESRK